MTSHKNEVRSKDSQTNVSAYQWTTAPSKTR
jgi:hypothetical protein